jgi:hypothetical protein
MILVIESGLCRYNPVYPASIFQAQFLDHDRIGDRLSLYRMTATPRIALSTKGLKSADRISKKDFRFISGSDVFVCDRFQAAFISPRVSRLISTDPVIDNFSLEHADSRSFDLIRQLTCGEPIFVDERNIELLQFLMEDLGNDELSSLFFEYLDEKEELTVSNCISRLHRKFRLGIGISRECDFIGNHFSSIPVDSIQSLELDIMHDILRLDSFQIETEDYLLKFVIELGPSYSELIGDVRFEYLSSSSIDLFFEHIQLNEVDEGIWQQLWHRCRHRIASDGSQDFRTGLRSLLIHCPESGSPFSGLISHLSGLCGGNVHEKGVVSISCSSNNYNQCSDSPAFTYSNHN